MAYEIIPKGDPDSDGVQRRWFANVFDIDGHPDQRVETEYEGMEQADADAAAAALEQDVLADPAKYFGG